MECQPRVLNIAQVISHCYLFREICQTNIHKMRDVIYIPSLMLTASLPLKIDGRKNKQSFLGSFVPFSGAFEAFDGGFISGLKQPDLYNQPFWAHLCIGILKLNNSHILWSNYSDLTRPHPKWWFSKGNPLISGKSRVVKYYNLARYTP